jgi:hypothetical protein
VGPSFLVARCASPSSSVLLADHARRSLIVFSARTAKCTSGSLARSAVHASTAYAPSPEKELLHASCDSSTPPLQTNTVFADHAAQAQLLRGASSESVQLSTSALEPQASSVVRLSCRSRVLVAFQIKPRHVMICYKLLLLCVQHECSHSPQLLFSRRNCHLLPLRYERRRLRLYLLHFKRQVVGLPARTSAANFP